MIRTPSQSQLFDFVDADDAADSYASSSPGDTSSSDCGLNKTDPTNALEAAQVRVTFSLEHAETQPGEIIRVVGSEHGLGCWDPGFGVALTTTAETYPLWSGSAILAASLFRSGSKGAEFVGAFAVEYKYVRDCRGVGGKFAWEECSNRRLAFPFSRNGSPWKVVDPGFELLGEGTPKCSCKVSRTFESSYELIGQKPLESGTFGAVWCCRARSKGGRQDLASEESYAVKRIDKTKLEERDFRLLFGCPGREGEISIHLLQQHPNIVRLFDMFDDRQIVSLVLELCRGGDLFSYIVKQHQKNNTGLPEKAVAGVARQLLSAMEFLHCQCIVHRDVKCENLLLNQEGLQPEDTTYKLCDFGFAARVPSGGQLHSVLGSPQTVAPEVLRKRPYSYPSDMWSTGVLLYIAFRGKEPFFAESMPLVVKKVLAGTYDLSGGAWAAVSADAKVLVGRLMSVDPFSRLTAANALHCEWLGGGHA